MAEQSTRTVWTALGANLLVAAAKIFAGMVGGSSAMLSEGAHSVADSTNEAFLLTSLRRSGRPADADHPFGYGMERFFWSLLAAVGIFVSGAVFSFYQGVTGLLHGEESGSVLVSYVVLAISFAAEGVSWLRAVRQLRGEASQHRRELADHVRRSDDPTVKTVLFEDSAALIGLVLAAAGIGLRQATGAQQWDAAAAIAIGLLLTYVAFRLGRDNKELLIGAAADPELRGALWRQLADMSEVDAVVELLTMRLGTGKVLVAVRLDIADGLDSDGVERVSARIDDELRAAHPEVAQVFLDATRASARERARSDRVARR